MAQQPELTPIEDNDRYTLFDVRYANGATSQAIKCKSCGRTSWNENDAKHRFCPCKGLYHDLQPQQRAAS